PAGRDVRAGIDADMPRTRRDRRAVAADVVAEHPDRLRSRAMRGRALAVVLAFDFTPNPVHAPIYEAARRPSHGVRLQIRKAGSGPDSLKLVAAGKVDLGVLDIQDLAIARAAGTDVVAVAA